MLAISFLVGLLFGLSMIEDILGTMNILYALILAAIHIIVLVGRPFYIKLNSNRTGFLV